MSGIYPRIGAHLPEQRPILKSDFQSSPKAVKAWIESLPLANAMQCAQVMVKALADGNRIRMSGGDRLEVMEMIRRPILQMVAAIEQQILQVNFPLPPNKVALGDMMLEFQRELAMGYRLAVFELCAPAGAVPFLRGGSVATALERAIHHHGAWLARCYMLYATPPVGVWQSLNNLYRFAAQLRMDDKAVAEPELADAKFTPRGAYVHALLLAISNPYRFSQRETYEAFYASRVWAEQGKLGQSRASDQSFAIAMDEDHGPGYLPEEQINTGSALLWFTPDLLTAELHKQLERARSLGGGLSVRLPADKTGTLAVDFVQRMVNAWKPMAAREFRRLEAMHEMDTLVGLAAVHYFLAGMKDFDAYLRESRGTGISMSERDRTASWAGANAENARPVKFVAKVLDQSLGGYRLLWESANQIKTRVGELVGLNLAGDEDDLQDWMLGLIRWMRISPDGQIDAGVELLARETRAAAIAPLDLRGQAKSRIRALLLDPSANASEGREVIAPNLLDRNAGKYELSSGENEVFLKINVQEDNGAYLRFLLSC